VNQLTAPDARLQLCRLAGFIVGGGVSLAVGSMCTACEDPKPAGGSTVSGSDTAGTVGDTTGDGGVQPDTIGKETAVVPDTVGQETTATGKTCRCTDPGAKLEPDAGCATWNDKNQCTAWHSVVAENDKSPDASNKSWPSGQQFCGFGCCIKLVCP
jgi:hypothetical protein